MFPPNESPVAAVAVVRLVVVERGWGVQAVQPLAQTPLRVTPHLPPLLGAPTTLPPPPPSVVWGELEEEAPGPRGFPTVEPVEAEISALVGVEVVVVVEVLVGGALQEAGTTEGVGERLGARASRGRRKVSEEEEEAESGEGGACAGLVVPWEREA